MNDKNKIPGKGCATVREFQAEMMIESFRQEHQKLREQLAKERELRKELVDYLSELLDDHKNHCFQMNFEERVESLIQKAKDAGVI